MQRNLILLFSFILKITKTKNELEKKDEETNDDVMIQWTNVTGDEF